MIMETLITFALAKGSGHMLGPHLIQSEIDCRCKFKSCKRTLISPKVVKAFKELREDWGSPIKITSGYRCQRHNMNVHGTDDSRHKLGLAIDMSVPGHDLDQFYEYAKQHFDRVIKYETEQFLHADMYL